MQTSMELAAQFSGLAVGGRGPGMSAASRLKSKRSQRFTVPVQPPNPAASPPFSNSTSDDSGPTTGTGSGSSFALSNTASSHSDHHLLLANGSHHGYASEGVFLPANFAQTGPPSGCGSMLTGGDGSTNAGTSTGYPDHAFLHQDPFAVFDAASRSRALSSGSSSASGHRQVPPPSSSHHSQHQHSGSLSANGIWAEQPIQQQQYPSHQQRNSGALEPFNGKTPSHRTGPFSPPGPMPHHQQPLQSQHPLALRQQHSNGQSAASSGPDSAPGADDIIPTAIVIKNIPFSFPSTSLMQIIEELTLAPPYAFNYHYDMGVFRGLAFANFHTPQETDACVAALNGFEIQGRKLRVEYKKVLQAGEKERIERDKAIKRMRSMQLDRERIIQQQQAHVQQLQQQIFGQQHPGHLQQLPQGHMQHLMHQQHLQQQQPHLQHQHQPQQSIEDYEDYGRAVHPSNSIFNQPSQFVTGSFSPPMEMGDSYPSQSHSGSGASTSSRANSGTSLPTDLDMNDAQTLELYSRVLLFKEDALRDELAFSKTLSNVQRRIVHLIAQKLNLEHRSAGSGEDRYVVVSKSGSTGSPHKQSQPQRSLRTRASAYPMLNPDPYAPPQPSLLPDGMGMHAFNNALRKKSMPDLRNQQQHPLYSNPAYQQSYSQSQASIPSGGSSSPHSNITPRHSTHDLRAVAASANNRRSMYMHTAAPGENNNIPPVPTLPANLMQNGLSNGQQQNNKQSASTAVPSNNGSDRRSIIFGSGSVDLNLEGLPKAASSLTTSTLSLDSKIVGSPVTPVNSASAGGVVRQPRGPDHATSWTRSAGNAPSTAL